MADSVHREPSLPFALTPYERMERRLHLVSQHDAISSTLYANRARQAVLRQTLQKLERAQTQTLRTQLIPLLDLAKEWEEKDENSFAVVPARGTSTAAEDGIGSMVDGSIRVSLPVLPHLLQNEPFRSQHIARARYRDVFTSAGLQQLFSASAFSERTRGDSSTFKKRSTQQKQVARKRKSQLHKGDDPLLDPALQTTAAEEEEDDDAGLQHTQDTVAMSAAARSDTASLRHYVLAACRRYLAVRTAREGSIDWLLEFFHFHSTFPSLPSNLTSAAPLTGAAASPLGRVASDKVKLIGVNPQVLAQTLDDIEVSLLSLPFPARHRLATEGFEADPLQRQQRSLERQQRPVAPSGDEDDEVDLLDWADIARSVHAIFTRESCRTKWLMMERPPLPLPFEALQAAQASGAASSSSTTAASTGASYLARWPRPLRWHLRGPNHSQFTSDENERFQRIIGQMQPLQGRWEEVARRLGTSRQGWQALSQYQRLMTASKLKSSPQQHPSADEELLDASTAAAFSNAAEWTEEQSRQLQEYVHLYGNRWGIFAEWLDLPLRSARLVLHHYARNLDPNVITVDRWAAARALLPMCDAEADVAMAEAIPESSTAAGPSSNKRRRTTATAPKAPPAKRREFSKSDTWTPEEDTTLRQLMTAHHDQPPWLVVRHRLPGRTHMQVKERWASLQKGAKPRGRPKKQK